MLRVDVEFEGAVEIEIEVEVEFEVEFGVVSRMRGRFRVSGLMGLVLR